MEMMSIILRQILTMVLLAGVGFAMFRSGKISGEGSKALGNILIYLSLPCVIINSFLVERTPERLSGLLVSTVLAVVVLALSMGISRLVLGRHAIDNFSGSFSNPGFFGAPLIVASIGSGGVFYIASFIAFLNLLQWTYGVSLLENSDDAGMLVPGKTAGKKGNLLTRLAKAPFMIAILIGLFFFLTGFPMPGIVSGCISSIAGLNTPIAMFTIGIYMAQTDILKMLVKPRLYLVSLVRLVLIPLVTLGLLWLLPQSMGDLKLAVLIASACPAGSNVAVYAQLHGKDYPYAVETVVISTFLSVVTLPLLAGLAAMMG